MSKTVANLARNLNRIIHEKGMRPGELAFASGLSDQYVHQLLHEKNANPKIEYLEKVAGALGTTVSRLLAGPEDEPDVMDAVKATIRLLQDFVSNGPDSPLLARLGRVPPDKKE